LDGGFAGDGTLAALVVRVADRSCDGGAETFDLLVLEENII